MTVRNSLSSAALLWAVLGLSQAAPAADPVPLPLPPGVGGPRPSSNQRLAETIVLTINQSGRVRDYKIDVTVRGGVVELAGSVCDQAQHDEVVRLVQGIPAVERVIDRIVISSGLSELTRVQAPVLPEGSPSRLPDPTPGQAGRSQGPVAQGPAAPGGAAAGAPVPEPVPVFRGGAPGPYDFGPPRMPPYAWPTYAPYNNFSRVAYPEAYPYNAWPFIGPIHPFPKVPLGWRSVKLEWDDGYWWFSRVGNKYDWWRLRFW